MDKMTLSELLDFIDESIDVILERFKPINCVDDFLDDAHGLEKLDSIILRIQTIGEALKNIDKHNKGFLENVANKSYWSNIIKLRELISHHYIDLDAEVIFDICDEKLQELKQNIGKLKKCLR
jgi:uncharacterized protein with HEPN domain